MSQVQITVNGQTQVVQLGALSPAVNAQITAAVTSTTASAATATAAASTATAEAVVATTAASTATSEAAAAATSAGQAAAYVAELPSLVVQQSATFASLPASPLGLFLVLADETKGGNPTIYLFTASHRYWVAMVQDA